MDVSVIRTLSGRPIAHDFCPTTVLGPAYRSPASCSLTARQPRRLPGAVTQVETGLSYRKQSLGPPSTRNVPAHNLHSFLGGFADGVA